MEKETMLIHYLESDCSNQGAVVPPIFQNSLFVFPSWDAIDEAFSNPNKANIYTRGNNPGVTIVEEKIAKLCHGEKAKMFSSGMAAIAAAILHWVKAGDHIITIHNIYGPANNFIKKYLQEKCHVESTFVEGKNLSDFAKAIRPNTKLIYLESPSSMVFSLQDITAIAALARENKIRTVIDNTWSSPIFQMPLDMGVDFEIHSCSKYLGGHSDTIAGIVVGKAGDIEDLIAQEGALLGAKMSPFEAWLILRSLRTLKIRMLEHQASAKEVVSFLENHPAIAQVNHPHAKNYDQKELATKQMTGYSGLFSFRLQTEDLTKIKTFVNALTFFKIGVSWGGYESLVYAPAISYLKELDQEQFQALGISLGDIRVSIGLENVQDLITDLQQALDAI